MDKHKSVIDMISDLHKKEVEELEALLKERDGGAHDHDCKANPVTYSGYLKSCTCGHDDVVKYFKKEK